MHGKVKKLKNRCNGGFVTKSKIYENLPEKLKIEKPVHLFENPSRNEVGMV